MRDKFNISVLDALILIKGMLDANEHPKIGYADPYISLQEILMRFDQTFIPISRPDLESCLWSLNMLDEEVGKIWHPLGRPFNSFIASMLKYPYKFDREYNQIVSSLEKKKKGE